MTENRYAQKSSHGEWWPKGADTPLPARPWSLINRIPVVWHPDTCESIPWEQFDQLLPSKQAEYGFYRVQGEMPPTPENQMVTEWALKDVDGQPYWDLQFGPLPTPEPLPDEQFAKGLWNAGLITFDECGALAATGAVPGALQEILDEMDDEGEGMTPRKEATMLLKSAAPVPFDAELVDLIRQELGWSEAQLRAAWTRWATL